MVNSYSTIVHDYKHILDDVKDFLKATICGHQLPIFSIYSQVYL